eukprot:1850708-Amphidinium_carterae.1
METISGGFHEVCAKVTPHRQERKIMLKHHSSILIYCSATYEYVESSWLPKSCCGRGVVVIKAINKDCVGQTKLCISDGEEREKERGITPFCPRCCAIPHPFAELGDIGLKRGEVACCRAAKTWQLTPYQCIHSFPTLAMLRTPLWRRCLGHTRMSTNTGGLTRTAAQPRVQYIHVTPERSASQPLKQFWEQRSSWSHRTASEFPMPSTEAFHSRLLDAHKWRLVGLSGDIMETRTPPSAKHLFISCGVIEGVFLIINVLTGSPYVFERAMTYHLKYSGIIIAFWGGTYWGLAFANYGP